MTRPKKHKPPPPRHLKACIKKAFKKLLYTNILGKRKLSIRETFEALNSASTWVLIITFALLISLLAGVAVKITVFHNQTNLSLNHLLSDVHLFLIFCLTFFVLIFLYMRLYYHTKRFEVLYGMNEDITHFQAIKNTTKYFENTSKYKKEALLASIIRLPTVAIFIIMILFIGHKYDINIINAYHLCNELLIPSFALLIMMILIIELPVWHVYGIVGLLFDNKNIEKEPMDDCEPLINKHQLKKKLLNLITLLKKATLRRKK